MSTTDQEISPRLSPIGPIWRLLMQRLGTAVGERARTQDTEDEMSDVERLHDESAGDALLLTPEEAAKLLRLGRTTVYALMKAGDLRPVHIGRSCRISHAELERFVGRLDSPPPSVPRRSPAQRRTARDQGGLFDLGPTSPDVA